MAVIAIGTGDSRSRPGTSYRTAGQRRPGHGFIVHDLRLPRVLCALLVGAALGMAGAVFQSVSRNPLGSPDLLGFAHGAAVGALVVIILFEARGAAVAVGALVGGAAGRLAVYLLAYKQAASRATGWCWSASASPP